MMLNPSAREAIEALLHECEQAICTQSIWREDLHRSLVKADSTIDELTHQRDELMSALRVSSSIGASA